MWGVSPTFLQSATLSKTPPAHSLPHFSQNFMRFLRDVLTPHNSCPHSASISRLQHQSSTTCLNNGTFRLFPIIRTRVIQKEIPYNRISRLQVAGMVIFFSHSLSSPCGKKNPNWSMPRMMQILRKRQHWRPGHHDLLFWSSPKALKATGRWVKPTKPE